MNILSITTARAQRMAKYPQAVLELVDLLGILPEAAADQRIESRLSIARQLAESMIQEREQGEIWSGPQNYNSDLHMRLADALGAELGYLVQRERQLSGPQWQETAKILQRIAA